MKDHFGSRFFGVLPGKQHGKLGRRDARRDGQPERASCLGGIAHKSPQKVAERRAATISMIASKSYL